MEDRIVCLVVLESGNRKKVHLETGAYEEVLAALKKLAPITDNTLILIHDEELDDYIDLEVGQTVPNKAKLQLSRKVAVATNVPACPSSPSSDCGPSSPSSSSVVLESLPSSAGSDTLSSPTPTSSSPNHERQHSGVENVPLENPRDFLEFRMPDLGPYEQELQQKRAISGNLRRLIVNKLFQACWKITRYPTHRLYQTATEQLVSRYPHLIDHLDGRDGLDMWTGCLRNKFKNARKQFENCSPEMLARKQKYSHKKQKQTCSDTEPPNKKLCRLANSNHLAMYDEGAMMQHCEWLEENAGTTEDEAKRQRLLATANRRHKQLQTMSVQEALTTFPFLCVESTLLMEFEVVFQKRIADKMEAGFASLSDIILKHGTEREVASFLDAAQEDGIRAVLAFMADRCADSFEAILTEADVPFAPCLLSANGEVSLHIDGELVLTASSLLGGLCCLFASFWVFNIQYPKRAHRVLTFVEHAFLGLASTKPRVKALELINFYRINSTH